MRKEKTRKIIMTTVIILFMVLFITSVQAKLTIDITINPSFQVGERATFDYVITSDKDTEIIYYSAVICPNYLLPFLIEKTASLKTNEPFYGEEDSGLIFEEPIEPQTCKAIVSILKPEIETKEFSKSFNVIAKSSFDVKILTCKDPECKQPSKVFVKDQPIYVRILTEKEGRDIGAEIKETTCKTPSLNSIPLTVSNKETSFSSGKVGTYEIEVIASKAEYKTIKEKIQIGIIEKEPKIVPVIESFIVEKKEKIKESEKIIKTITDFFRITSSAILDVFR